MDELISITEAETRVFSACVPLGTEQVPLQSAIGRVLAAPITADRDLPPFPRSMMDGVAFSSEKTAVDTPLRIAGLHAAGDAPPRVLEAGEAWEIMTGAAVPADCDTVVPYEDLTESFVPGRSFTPGQCIHRRGLDAEHGSIIVKAGTRIGPAEIAIAASVGVIMPSVYQRPRISIITTGDEAVPADSVPEPWQIRRSNGPMLEAALIRLGHPPCLHLHVPDDLPAASRAIDQALGISDCVILCGGISKGRKDFIRGLLEEKLGKPTFHGVKLRPGKPLAFWSGAPLVFALPGNPVSVLMTFTRFVVPALLRMENGVKPPFQSAVPDVRPLASFSCLLPVAQDETGRLIPRPSQNSGDYVSTAGVIGMIEIPPETGFTPGQSFPFYPFP